MIMLIMRNMKNNTVDIVQKSHAFAFNGIAFKVSL